MVHRVCDPVVSLLVQHRIALAVTIYYICNMPFLSRLCEDFLKISFIPVQFLKIKFNSKI